MVFETSTWWPLDEDASIRLQILENVKLVLVLFQRGKKRQKKEKFSISTWGPLDNDAIIWLQTLKNVKLVLVLFQRKEVFNGCKCGGRPWTQCGSCAGANGRPQWWYPLFGHTCKYVYVWYIWIYVYIYSYIHSDGIQSSDRPVHMYTYDIYEYIYIYFGMCAYIHTVASLTLVQMGGVYNIVFFFVHMYAVALPVLAQMGIQDIFPHFFIYTFISSLRVDLFTCMYMNTFGFHVSFWIFRLYMYISKIESNYICTNICMYIYVRTYIFRLYISM